MNIECTITFHYESNKQARAIQKALAIDDESFVTSTIKDSTLIAHIESTALPSFLHTLDDYLACVTIAEDIMKKKQR